MIKKRNLILYRNALRDGIKGVMPCGYCQCEKYGFDRDGQPSKWEDKPGYDTKAHLPGFACILYYQHERGMSLARAKAVSRRLDNEKIVKTAAKFLGISDPFPYYHPLLHFPGGWIWSFPSLDTSEGWQCAAKAMDNALAALPFCDEYGTWKHCLTEKDYWQSKEIIKEHRRKKAAFFAKKSKPRK